MDFTQDQGFTEDYDIYGHHILDHILDIADIDIIADTDYIKFIMT